MAADVGLPEKAILIVDDDEDILTAGRLLLKRHYSRIDTCSTPSRIESLMAECRYAAILLDMNFGPGESTGREGFYWLKQILKLDPDAVVILITAHGGIDVAVDAIKLGATDFISKPWQNEKFIATLSASVKLSESRSEARQLKQANSALLEATHAMNQPMLGDSPAIKSVLNMIERTAPTEANVLLLGENGTGKELAARALHQQSNRREKIFMSVDLGAIAESLFESELFGHRKGAFTGASQDRTGRLQAANGGTLFLDEIGNLPLHLQAKLLSVLEQRQVIPLGATQPVDIDIRIITATNLTIEQLKQDHIFRQDLLFRLNTVEIELPPLRHRIGDIPVIAEFYAALYSKKYSQTPRSFSTSAIQAMTEYAWPGNIRALRHAIERAVILSENEIFQPEDFQLGSEDSGQPSPVTHSDMDDLNLEKLEKRTIQQALSLHRYNISHTARELGLTRAALYRRMEKYGI